MNVLLVAAYELGHQPVAIAAPAAALQARGHAVRLVDLSLDAWDAADAAWAERVVASVPMHTATRLVRELAPSVDAPLAVFGLYAHLCADVATPLTGLDPVADIVGWVQGNTVEGAIEPPIPARDLLPPLDRYVRYDDGREQHLVGMVLASDGCAHRCRHCPVPVVWDGRFRAVPVDRVLADVEQLVAAGAEHITFGDPDFLNGPQHARRVAAAMHHAFPQLTFDCTVKVEHVLRHRDVWPELAAAGCRFVVSAFESTDDAILARLDKGHTARDAAAAVDVLRAAGIVVRPSWMPFTPWSTRDTIVDILEFTAAHDLVGATDPIQHTIRLLLPQGSLLLDQVPDLGPWDPLHLTYQWRSPLDSLQREMAATVEQMIDAPIGETYDALRALAGLAPLGLTPEPGPHLTEPWFCCAEPTAAQALRVAQVGARA